ncbi:MAG: MetQ/NlpA family ABC transporter substrate-binding protein [Synergistaceae bacterium]|jgi:D-methionine transport system substrate-binding protein|nr:MetQ/NlpA family ABC transporter substrate-binding protein [Synergistaceae bacterium]
MKRILTAFLVLTMVAGFSADAASAAERTKVKVGVTGEIYQDIWGPAIKELAAEGIDLELVSFSDYTLPNAALDAGEIDLNTFQHYNYLNNEVKTKGYKITAIADNFLSSMSVYSKKIKNLKELKKGDKIAIPNDVINTGRALLVIQGAGLIKVDPAKGNTPETTDIVENLIGIEFVPVDAAQVPSLLPDVAAGVINGGYAIDFGLSPAKDAIFYDDLSFYKDKGYVNIVAARTADKDSEVYKRVVKAFHSDEVKQVLAGKFQGSLLPVWD